MVTVCMMLPYCNILFSHHPSTVLDSSHVTSHSLHTPEVTSFYEPVPAKNEYILILLELK